MSELFEQSKLTEADVIEGLDRLRIGDASAKDLLDRFVLQLQAESDTHGQESGEASARASLEADFALANLYARTNRYKGEAYSALEDLFDQASVHGFDDIVEKTIALMRELNQSADSTSFSQKNLTAQSFVIKRTEPLDFLVALQSHIYGNLWKICN